MTPFSEALLPLLGDPETHAPLSLATPDELTQLRAAVRAGSARRRDGQAASADFEAALLNPGRNVAYLVQGGIPNLLIEDRLECAGVL